MRANRNSLWPGILARTAGLCFCLGLLGSSSAHGQDSTASRGFWSHFPFSGIHMDLGGGIMPYLDASEPGALSTDGKLSLPIKRWSGWSLGFTSMSVFRPDSTSYVATVPVTGSPTFHPGLVSMTASLEVQRRWNERRRLHPLAALGGGMILNSYDYFVRTNGDQLRRTDELTKTYFTELSVGAELNLKRHFRATIMAGVRSGGRMKIRDAQGSNGGGFMMLNFEMGRFGTS